MIVCSLLYGRFYSLMNPFENTNRRIKLIIFETINFMRICLFLLNITYAKFNSILNLEFSSPVLKVKKRTSPSVSSRIIIGEKDSRYHSSWIYVCFNYREKHTLRGVVFKLKYAIALKFLMPTCNFYSIHRF